MNWQFGIDSVWQNDEDAQMDALRKVAKNIRKVEDPELCEMVAQDMRKNGMFYVPTENYISVRFGKMALDYEYGIYSGGYCTLFDRLAMPMRLMNGEVIGFIGYTNNTHEDDKGFIKYLYPTSDVIEKGRYLYIEPDEYIKAIKDGYICIVDGLFDKRSLQLHGVNAVSLCGSALTPWHIRYLSFIKHIIVVSDNDRAGRELVGICQKHLNNCVEIKQGDTKDIDDFLKTRESLDSFLDTFEVMKSEKFRLSHVVRPNPYRIKSVPSK